MNAAVSQNLVGITGITRRLAMDGALDADKARAAQEAAAKARIPIAQWLVSEKLVTAAQLTADICDESPFWAMDKVFMTPHASAASDVAALFRHVAGQIERLESGKPLEHLVDRRAGY